MKYTTYGRVKQEILSNYLENNTKESFVDALITIQRKGCDESGKNANIKEPVHWNDLAFEKYVDQLVFNIDDLMAGKDIKIIKEELVIPYGRDVFVFQHMPYVNDGIHEHNYFEINYVYRGECSQYIGERRIIHEGEISFIAPHTKHNVQVENDSFVISFLVRQSTFDAIFWNFQIGRASCRERV